MPTTEVLSYILVAAAAVALFSMLFNFRNVRTWINVLKGGKFKRIGFLLYNSNGEASEARIPAAGKNPPIGLVAVSDPAIDGAVVQLLVSNPEDNSGTPEYREYGYITSEGYIYKRTSRDKRSERIGYTACPSDPSKPTTDGERKWKTLKLKCTLNAYPGVPGNSKNIQPIASCSYTGFPSAAKNEISPEGRACAFGVFYRSYYKKPYTESVKSYPYGWKDTALIAATIFTLLYMIAYLIAKFVVNTRFVGYHFDDAMILTALYFPLWSIIRQIKIHMIETSGYVQARLDLFNKTLGQKGIDFILLVCCAMIFGFTGGFYRLDFIPITFVMAFGIVTNLSLPANSIPWRVLTKEEEEEEETAGNPPGDIERNFSWQLDRNYNSPEMIKGNLTLYFTSGYIHEIRRLNPFYSQRQLKPASAYILDMFHMMKEHPSLLARTRYLKEYIERQTAGGASADPILPLQFALDFVQEPNITFVKNEDSLDIDRFSDYIRWPDETLFDKAGDCNSKALLAAMIFYLMDFDPIYLYSRTRQHAAIGIRIRPEWMELPLGESTIGETAIRHNGHPYLICEVVSDSFSIGSIIDGLTIQDFDDIIELRHNENDVDDVNPGDDNTRIYTWELDSELGNRLEGAFAIEFDPLQIASLRKANPFLSYGSDNATYEDNIRKILQYLKEDPERSANVRKLTDYIQATVNDAGLPELDRLQFALDFVQAPNITYRVDEESAPIGYAREYMRFPDEVLYDKEGDCDCKTSLMAAIFHEMGYHVLIMLSAKLQHAAIAVECPAQTIAMIPDNDKPRSVKEYSGKSYVYCETTGDGFRIGHIDKEQSIDDFETLVEL